MSVNSLELIKNHLDKSIGEIGVKMFQQSVSKLNISEKSSKEDLEKLVFHIGKMITPIYGNDKSKTIQDELKKKFTDSEKTDTITGSGIDIEINSFLAEKALPTEADITDYANYLSIKYGGTIGSVEKNLFEKVKSHVITGITGKKTQEEINNFLIRYPSPDKKDIDDFINYLRLSKLSFQENELRESIERERLYRKFHGKQDAVGETEELNHFIDFMKSNRNPGEVSKLMQKKGLGYLIKDDKGISNKSVSEFIELMTPTEKDTEEALSGMGLEHMIKKNNK